MSEIITPALVSLDEPLGTDKRAVIDALAARVAATGRASDGAALAADVLADIVLAGFQQTVAVLAFEVELVGLAHGDIGAGDWPPIVRPRRHPR